MMTMVWSHLLMKACEAVFFLVSNSLFFSFSFFPLME
jgi:hypothetical protein